MPHTKHQIQQLLQEYQISPRHRWGQNFLIDLNLMRLLADSAELTGTETVLEVGCGTGSLTELLAASARAVIAVDIDETLIEIAKRQLAQHQNITFICADILRNKNTLNPQVTREILQQCERHPGPFHLIANLPYQIATPLLINLLLGTSIPDRIAITVQAEVADRIVTQPGSKSYGPLSIMMQSTGTVTPLRRVGPLAFWPIPKIDSAMVLWRKDPLKLENIKQLISLKQVVEALLGHRRKKIRTCLARRIPPDRIDQLLTNSDIDPDARGETLPPEKFVALSNCLSQYGL
jgi:16S rRNA (adenine1518-N6/adenine1519-N6)-dimethyltransferase